MNYEYDDPAYSSRRGRRQLGWAPSTGPVSGMERKVEVVTEGKVIIAVYWEVTDEEGRVKPREATYAVSRDELALMAVGPPLKHDMLRGHFVRLLNQAFAETGLDREDGRQPPFKVCRLKHGAGPRGPHRYKRRKSEAAA